MQCHRSVRHGDSSSEANSEGSFDHGTEAYDEHVSSDEQDSRAEEGDNGDDDDSDDEEEDEVDDDNSSSDGQNSTDDEDDENNKMVIVELTLVSSQTRLLPFMTLYSTIICVFRRVQ